MFAWQRQRRYRNVLKQELNGVSMEMNARLVVGDGMAVRGKERV
jgi:hypothetical protein